MQQPAPQFGRDPYGIAEQPHGKDLAAVIAAEAVAEARLETRAGNGAAAHYEPVHSQMGEVTQAVSVAAAYFEDTLQQSPSTVLSAGSTSAEALGVMLAQAGFGVVGEGGAGAVRVTEIVGPEAVMAQAASARVPRSWLSGVRGALKS